MDNDELTEVEKLRSQKIAAWKERDAARAEADKALADLAAERERADYMAGYEADLVCIRKVLDEVDAPHDPEDGCSLEPKRIRLLGEHLAAERERREEWEDMCADYQTRMKQLLDEITALRAKLDSANSAAIRQEDAKNKALAELATLQARAVKLPQRFTEASDGYTSYMIESPQGEWIKTEDVEDAIRAAGVKVEGV